MQFQRVYFAPRKFEMERFMNIAQHPVFSKSVKELVYDGRLFRQEYQQSRAYQGMLSRQKRSRQDPCKHGFYPMGCLEDDLEQYSDCVKEQLQILDNRADLRALLAGLGQMPIKRLTVQDSFRNYDRVSIHPTDHSWYDENCELRFPRFLPSSWDEFWLPLEWDDHAPNVLTWDCRGLANLFSAFSEHCHQIGEFHIGTQNSPAPMVLFHPSSGTIDHIDRLAPQLTSLKLDCKPYRSDEAQDVDAAVSRLIDLIHNAKEIKALSSCINIDKQHSLQIIQGWRDGLHLSLLDLGNFRATQDSLTAIIKTQKDTLSELKLRNMRMIGPDSWEGLGDEIGKHLKLQKITINELYSEPCDSIMPSSDLQRKVAHLIMQWASPVMLETERYPLFHPFLVVLSLKAKGDKCA